MLSIPFFFILDEINNLSEIKMKYIYIIGTGIILEQMF